ncbi:MAG: DsbA family protein [Candidatus Nitrosotenuis sp.]|uniref:DSBA oxidoreductase n=1 Tax=Candidatus Nitrosotenuis uzonensis TaxID=1407055 RepID=A0A812EY71_9ARCH|nr:DsbA family protein [Candidatus Nitrosotenuis uzonensis]MCA2004001.1 DsbA family protein [Candidatus Nitrosotenuis sp.]CAE6499073.1 DSBA oxidoreductase [Candidatus Nitrosotenuis uzonensis]
MAKYHLIAIPVAIGIVTGIFASSYFGNQNDDAVGFTKSEIIRNGSPILGNSFAPITIVEFGDYQCTYCMKFHSSSLETIKEEYIQAGKANLVFQDFALNGPASVLAAEASHCAKDQNKFWEYHDEIYKNWDGENTGWVTKDSLREFAKSVDLQMEQFDSCLDSSKYREQVLQTYDLGEKLGINATPSFLIISGDRIIKITGNQPIDVFRKTLDGL